MLRHSCTREGERYLRPVKLNYLTLGNALPHLHTHIVPRYADDPVPGRPFPFDFLAARSRSTSWTTADSQRSGYRPTCWPCG